MGQLQAAALVEWQPALFEVGQPSGWNIGEPGQVDERETAAETECLDVGHSSPYIDNQKPSWRETSAKSL